MSRFVIGLLIAFGSPSAWAKRRVVERERVVERTVLDVGDCVYHWNPPFHGDRSYFTVVVTERLEVETYLIQQTCAGLLTRGREELLTGTGREFSRVESRAVVFRGTAHQERCQAFVAALRHDLTSGRQTTK